MLLSLYEAEIRPFTHLGTAALGTASYLQHNCTSFVEPNGIAECFGKRENTQSDVRKYVSFAASVGDHSCPKTCINCSPPIHNLHFQSSTTSIVYNIVYPNTTLYNQPLELLRISILSQWANTAGLTRMPTSTWLSLEQASTRLRSLRRRGSIHGNEYVF